ncbi:hypothetical protein NIES593_01500 [Hydrococcus rivularis NIES-593]|uniref:Uncharacterized protein n=2 Tax=Hydrococcus TaxID=1616833 RepID=A0A1U7HT42_9CYAN|nr:hypothetical protein NIES593_01500 [Hydrococcus rivularis NIES-593]
MFDLNLLFEFSRNHCVAICTLMVPANLLLTLRTVLLVGRLRPQAQVRQAMVTASFFALTMLLHVFSWFIVGVVMAATYILLTLACVCLGLNLWAIAHPASMHQLLRASIPSLDALGQHS